MPRAHRLKPLVLSQEEILHAYTSPPISEKSGLPTIVVTPAEPASASDFHIHFFSPEPTKVSFFQRAKKGIRHYFVPPPPSPLKLEEDEGQVVEIKPKIWRPVSPLRTVEYAYSAVPTEEVQSPPPTGEIRLSDDSDDEDMESGMLRSGQQSLFRSSMSLFSTRRVRIGLCLALPLAAVAFHVVGHQLGMFGTIDDGADISQ